MDKVLKKVKGLAMWLPGERVSRAEGKPCTQALLSRGLACLGRQKGGQS